MHRDIARIEAVIVLHPVFAVAAAQDHLHHGRVACQRERLGIVDRRGRKRRRVQHERDVMLRGESLHDVAADRILQRRDRDRQRIHAARFERVDQRIEHGRVGRLQMRLVEQDRDDGRALGPARLPVFDGRRVARGVIQRGCGQRARRRRLVAPAERAPRDAAHERLGIAHAALAQIAPQPVTQVRVRRAAREQIRVFLQVAGKHRERLPVALRERDDLLDPIRPVRLAAQMIDDDDARMLQHIVDIEIDGSRLPQVRDIREPHARKAFAKTRHDAREQRQRRVRGTEDHDIRRLLVDTDDALRIVDETAGDGAQQMHRAAFRPVAPVRSRRRSTLRRVRAATHADRDPRRSARSG